MKEKEGKRREGKGREEKRREGKERAEEKDSYLVDQFPYQSSPFSPTVWRAIRCLFADYDLVFKHHFFGHKSNHVYTKALISVVAFEVGPVFLEHHERGVLYK